MVVTVCGRCGDAVEKLTTCVERADAALYYAKSHGRNCVQSCEAVVATGAIKAKLRDRDEDIELF